MKSGSLKIYGQFVSSIVNKYSELKQKVLTEGWKLIIFIVGREKGRISGCQHCQKYDESS